MNRTVPLPLAAVIAVALLGAPRAAAAGDYQTVQCEVVRTVNATQSRVWVTIYDVFSRHLDYGWVEACSFRDWKAGSYACGSYYKVRGEVKNYAQNANVYDTTMQIHPMMTKAFGPANPSNVVTLKKGQGNYYWDQGATISDTDGKVQGCDLTPPQGTPSRTLMLQNVTDAVVNVTVTATRTGQVLATNVCMQNREQKTWPATELAYTVRVYPLLGACGTSKIDGGTDVSVTGNPASNAMGVQLIRRITASPILF